MIRSVLATGASFILTSMVFANAYVNRQQFYPSVVYITKSNSRYVCTLKQFCVSELSSSSSLSSSLLNYRLIVYYRKISFFTDSFCFLFSMAVIYLQALVLVMLLGKLMSKVFFGRLRAAEFEHLMERSWYAITETCLAFTVFK